MRCGIFHTPYNKPHRTPRELFDWSMDLAKVCDESDYRDFMVGEHYTLARENIPLPEAVIAAAAMITRNIRFAPMAHLLPYHDPATLAIRIGWLSQVLEGRYFLGVAPGGHHTDAVLHGFENTSELPARQLEALDLMEKVWKAIPFREKGQFYQAGYPGPEDFPGYEVEYAQNGLWSKNGEKMEIAVTGLSTPSPSMKFAGERNYSPISFFGGTDQMRNHWDTWSLAMLSKGHTPDMSRFSVCREVFVADTDAEAKRLALKSVLADTWINYLFPIYKKFNLFAGIIKDSGLDLTADQLDMEFVAEHVWLCGSPETVADKILNFTQKVGVFGQLCTISHDYIDDPEPAREAVRRLGTEVMPLVNKGLGH